jgi:antibiotic biosynthesis monooxygenase (ABM) superfamily enzyme
MPATTDILILRRVRPGFEAEFAAAVRAWIPRAIGEPGYLGVFLLEPGPGSDEHGALLRFRTPQDWESFCAWPEYQGFLEDIRPMLVEEPRVRRLHGLEAWFSGEPARWKMAVLTWVGVNGMVWAAGSGVGAVGPEWPFWASFLLVNAIVVAGLTWVVMPVLTRLAGAWLTTRRAE